MGSREMIESGAMASYLTGSMNTLPNKLTKLENRPEKIGELEQHLVNLKECFIKVAGRGKTDDQAQEWMKQVRELFFDIEDWIDEKLKTPKQKTGQQLSTNMAGLSDSELEEAIRETPMAGLSEEEEEEISETNMAGSSDTKLEEEISDTNMAGLSDSELEKENSDTNMAGLSDSELEEENSETNMAGPSDSELEEEFSETNMAGPSDTKLEEEISEINMAGSSDTKLEEEISETNMAGSSEIEENIKGFIALTVEACGRCTGYKLLDEATTSGATVARVTPRLISSDSRLLLEERPYLRALDHPVQELKKHLTDDHQTQLKVVSIVGTGGLGKTTLAKKIHEELRGEFQCGAFVHIGSRHPSILTILVNMLQQIRSKQIRSKPVHLRDEQKVIAELWELLSEMRYFIILDGIWNIRTWRVISCALPRNNLGSRILITTRLKDVAKSCSPRYTDVVHQMEALSDDDSKRLFDQEAKTQGDDDVLKICGGIPLAITVAAGLSSGKYTNLEEPKTLGQHMLSSFEQYYSLSPKLTKILHMSYADLSIPLRSCFLYLSVFPEDNTIKKDHLIRRWVAEGFIPRIDDESMWVTGETYFNELISRRLIQPVYDYKDDQAVGCTVQPVILDFIRTLSREENFATTAAELSPSPFLCDTIRRFSLDCNNEDEAVKFKSSTEHLSRIRSLTVFGDVEKMHWAEFEKTPYHPDLPQKAKFKRTPYHQDLRRWEKTEDVHVSQDLEGAYFLLRFKFLRVLDLGDAKNLKGRHLKGIGGLFQLRYLRLATGISEVTEEIGELEQLETLDLMRRVYRNYDSGLFVKLRKLAHILYDVSVTPALDIEHLLGMSELEEVSIIDVSITSSSAEELGKLLSGSKRLRILGLRFSSWAMTKTQWVVPFLEVLAKSNLESLALYCPEPTDVSVGILMDSWKKASASAAEFQPRRFELKFYSKSSSRLVNPGFPPHMDFLGSLTHLHITAQRLEQEGLRILGNMQRLVLLNLSSYLPSLAGRRLVKEGAFPSLLLLSLTCHYGGMCLKFEQGAMPQLRRLVLSFTVSRTRDAHGNFNFGMENLACLTRIKATINCDLAKVSEIVHAEEEARKIVSKHINKPRLELLRDRGGGMSTY